MSYVVQASRASDSDRPPAYWIADNSKLLGQGRESRSNKPEEFYSLVPAERVRESLDDTTDYTSEKFHHLTPILPAAASAPEATDDSFNSDEFSTKLNVLSLHLDGQTNLMNTSKPLSLSGFEPLSLFTLISSHSSTELYICRNSIF